MLTCCQTLLQIGKATTKTGAVLAQVAVHGGREVSNFSLCTTLLWTYPPELLRGAWQFELWPGVVICSALP